MLPSQDQQWYALYLRSRYEKMVSLRLREKGVETLLPMIEEVRQYSDRRKAVLGPLFPGYVFVRTRLQDRLPIIQTDGVVRFVGAGPRPSPIPEEQIEWVRLAGQRPSKLKREPFLAEGVRVRVVEGPFAGIEGYVVTVKSSMRVVMSVECIGQSWSIEVSPGMVSALHQEVGRTY